MPIQFNCKNCDKILKTPDGSSGKNCKCPQCGEVMRIPDVATGPAVGTSVPDGGIPSSPQPAASNYPGGSQPGAAQPNPANNPFMSPKAPTGRPVGTGGMAPHRGGVVFGLGVASVFTGLFALVSCFCCLFLIFPPISLGTGIPAWLMGSKDLKAIKANAMDPNGKALTTTGFVCGIIGVCMSALGLLVWLVIFILNLFSMGIQMQDFRNFQ